MASHPRRSRLIVLDFFFLCLKILVFWDVMLLHRWFGGSRCCKATHSFKTSRRTHPTTQCHIPEDWTPQFQHLKTHFVSLLFVLFELRLLITNS
jgi:hypothetical protein